MVTVFMKKKMYIIGKYICLQKDQSNVGARKRGKYSQA